MSGYCGRHLRDHAELQGLEIVARHEGHDDEHSDLSDEHDHNTSSTEHYMASAPATPVDMESATGATVRVAGAVIAVGAVAAVMAVVM